MKKITKELVIASWINMVDSLFMILILIKIYSIYDEEIHFVKGYVYSLIGNQYNTDGTSTDNEYFFIHDELFDWILETDQNSDI